MKKILWMIIAATVFSSTSVFAVDISASSAVVIDAESGEVLYEKNADEKRGMASTTKIMTAIVAIEEGKKEDIVSVSSKAASVEGSSMYLKAGEKISLENLLYGLLLVSGNDAATAIAEHIGGDEEKFVRLMNEKAKKIGVTKTSFANPHGLSDERHYTTAKELAKITAYGLKNQVFSEIVKTTSKTIQREEVGKTYLVNHNKLLKTYDGCIGVKTGFTKATGRCLVSASERNGIKIVCVTLNAGDDWNDHRKMSDYVFENYKANLYGRSGTIAKTVKVKGGIAESVGVIYDKDICLAEKNKGEWSLYAEIPDTVSAPVEKGEVLGRITAVNKSGRKIFFDAVAEKDVPQKHIAKHQPLKNIAREIYKKWICFFMENILL